jgi:hypothetical protein
LDELKFYEDLILGSYKANISYTTNGKMYDKGKIKCLSSTLCVIDKVYVKQSEIHGKGVFAKQNIKPDEFVTFYPGDTLLLEWTFE